MSVFRSNGEKIEDVKGKIRGRHTIAKMTRDKMQTNNGQQNTTQKTEDRATQTPLKI
jgi:hypothetical protein